MNKRFLIVIIFLLIFLLGTFFLINKNNKKVVEKSALEDKNEERVGSYTIIYNANNFMYEVYDEYGHLLVGAPDKESCKFYIENPDSIIQEETLE